MKKILLLFTALYFFSLQSGMANKKLPHDNTTWKVIRERLFGGDNSYAYRYEKNIRIQLIGNLTQQDSTLFKNLVAELDILTETVKVTLVQQNSNFIIEL
ncbi:MAG TPA: hypothetical protein VJ945_05880, partial [Flavobacteriaceae bacterium]|nr:hypothetical protein [Flavobacteriaceae bacterium]